MRHPQKIRSCSPQMSVRCLTLEPTLSLAGSKNLGGVFKKVHRHLIACPALLRFNRACPRSPAAALPMLPTIVGTSILVTCAVGRSQSALACRLAKIPGDGIEPTDSQSRYPH